MDLSITVSPQNVANFEIAYSRASAKFRSGRVMKVISVRTTRLYKVYNVRFEQTQAIWLLAVEYQKQIDRALFTDIMNVRNIC